MRLAVMLVTGAALISGCNPTPAPIDPKECPAWRSVDYSKLPTHLNDDLQNPLFETIWKAWASEDASVSWSTDTPHSTVHFRTSPGGLSTDPTVREVIGRGITRTGKYTRGPRQLVRPIHHSGQPGGASASPQARPRNWIQSLTILASGLRRAFLMDRSVS